jgi:DNA-binding transcriptional LysR family regulator
LGGTGWFRTSSALAANEAAAQGLGIGNAPLSQVRALVDRGAVELTLTRFEPPRVPIHAVWPATKVLSSVRPVRAMTGHTKFG